MKQLLLTLRFQLLKGLVLEMGRHTPSTLRFLAHHNPISGYHPLLVSILISDPAFRDWLTSLENPTKTRLGFEIYTLPHDITSDWIKLHGQHEFFVERFIMDHVKPDRTFLDIGANIGYFSLAAAFAGKCHAVAFEPQRNLAELLAQSVAHNHLQDRVKVANLALSDVASTMKMTSCPGNTGHAQLVGLESSDAQAESVSVVVLDDWIKQNPIAPVSVIKIDTEGAEYQVLSGMTQLLDRDGPALVVELIEEHLAAFHASISMVRELLTGHGYQDVSASYAGRLGDDNSYFVRQR